jgi:heme/copper-type cytochrome/quinol oxidase subunit 1
MMTVTGIIALLMKHEQISQSFHQALHDHAHLMPLLVSVPAIIGFAIQHTSSSKGKKKPPSG